MVLLLAVLGGRVGSVELMIWLVLLVAGVLVIVRRYRAARRTETA